MAVFGFVLFILGIIFLIYAPIHARQNKRRTASVPGNITYVKEVRQSNSSIGNPMYDYFFTVDFVVDGVTHTTHSKRQAIRKEVGEEVTIKYNPAKPDDCHINEFHGETTKPIVIVGLVVTAVGLILFVAGLIF